jgi:hypothetical protein
MCSPPTQCMRRQSHTDLVHLTLPAPRTPLRSRHIRTDKRGLGSDLIQELSAQAGFVATGYRLYLALNCSNDSLG